MSRSAKWFFWWMSIVSVPLETDGSLCGRQGKVQMTVVSFVNRRSESPGIPSARYECYLGKGDADATISASRAYYTGEASSQPSLGGSISGLPEDTAAREVVFSNNNTFGAFYCTASEEMKQTTSIMTIFIRSDSYVIPADQLFTQMTNVGDRAVIIDMEPVTTDNKFLWRSNGSEQIGPQNNRYISEDYTRISNRTVNVSDGALYECHRNVTRNFGQHAMKRLIVRACTAGTWGPPGCVGICDYCYNGGACDDETGGCICAPGFMGPNCQTACGGNTFGYSCEFKCIPRGDEESCAQRNFCLLDPFGCTCNTGFRGLDCIEECVSGTYGAGCLETCHCANSRNCDRFTGVCEMGACAAGWRGENCQIPDMCPSGYYGDDCTEKCRCNTNTACHGRTGLCPGEDCAPGIPLNMVTRKCEECPDGYFGNSCTEECHCEADACNKTTGECVGCCKHQWLDLGPEKCQQGFIESERSVINPGQTPTIACTHKQATSLNGLVIGLSSSVDRYERVEAGGLELVEMKDVEGGLVQFTHVFSVPDADPSREYYCLLLGAMDHVLAWLNSSFVFSELPVLTAAPVPVFRNQTSVTIIWAAWNEETDEGDPPVVSYIPYWRPTSESWLNGSAVAFNESLRYTVYNLEADTMYEFAVSAVREGPGGEAPRRNVRTIKTPCHEPIVVPSDVTVVLTDDNHLNVSWKIDTKNIECSLFSFTIHIMTDGSSDAPKSVTADGDKSWIIVSEDLEPGQSYSAQVSVTTDDEFQGPLSAMSEMITLPDKEDDPTDSPVSLILFIVPVIVVVLLFVIIVALVLSRRRRKSKMPPSTSVAFITDDPVNGARDGVVSEGEQAHIYEQSEGTERKSSPPVPDEDNEPAAATGVAKPAVHRRPSENEDGMDDSNSGEVYQNVQTSILVSDLLRYFNEHRDGIQNEFQRLKKDQQFPCTVGSKKENSKKNRFRKMFAYDHSRVVLTPMPGDEDSDYYNASYILDQQGEKSFIAAQAPNTSSLNFFWVMIWQEKIFTIVMLTNLIENGKDRCSQYWPQSEGASKTFGSYVVSWAGTTHFANFDVRKLQVSAGNEVRTLYQFHYTTWQDMDVPEPGPLMEFIKHVKLRQGSCQAPILTHCSAGVGRTGTFIAIYCLMEVIKTAEKISIFDFVEKTRENRINMVQREVQYLFIYRSLIDFYLTRHTEMPSGLLARFNIAVKQDTLTEEFKLLSTFQDESALAVYEDHQERQRTRFPDMAPAMKGRIYLASPASNGNSDFIHATMFTSLMKKNAFIATQSPLPDTVEDFWRLVYDWKCSTIVMLNQLDGGDETCVKYWPEDGSSQYGHMSVALTERKKYPTHIHRRFKVSHVPQQGTLTVHQLQLLIWPTDHNFTSIKELKKSLGSIEEDDKAITLVQCIDGTGRSGVFVAVETALETVNVTGNIDVFNTVREMRRRNSHVIRTQEDYTLCYRIIKSMLSADETYANLGGM